MGNPIAHSRSPEIHSEFALQNSINITYEKLLVPSDGFEESTKTFLQRGCRGFNVTLPHKVNAYQLVDELSEDAALSHAVNTVVVEVLPEGGSSENNIGKKKPTKLIGYNTDGIGLVRDFQSNLAWDLKNKSVLVLGAGGAVRGVLSRVLKLEPQVLHIFNRTLEKAVKLEEQFSNPCLKAVSIDELMESYDFVISGSSAGLTLGDINLPATIIGPTTLCYDMIYSQTKTSFQAWCSEQGCQSSVDGLGMLVEQAAESFTLWTGCEVNTETVIKKLRATN